MIVLDIVAKIWDGSTIHKKKTELVRYSLWQRSPHLCTVDLIMREVGKYPYTGLPTLHLVHLSLQELLNAICAVFFAL